MGGGKKKKQQQQQKKNEPPQTSSTTQMKVSIAARDGAKKNSIVIDKRAGSEADYSTTSAVLSSLFVFAVVTAVYVRTAYPSISGGDSGELAVAICNGGVAHPPGYPTFTMLGRLFIRLLPFGHVAWRLSVMSALLGASAAALIHSTVYFLTHGNILAGLFAGFGFAFSPTVWLYSIQSEVFGLNNFLCALMVFLAQRFFDAYFLYEPTTTTSATSENSKSKQTQEEKQPSSSHGSSVDATTATSKTEAEEAEEESLRVQGLVMPWAYAGAFACGLAMTNQHTTVFPVMVTVLIVVHLLARSAHGLLNGVSIIGLFVALAAGMAPYLYMPYAAAQAPMDSWGDQSTWDGFIKHFFRVEYGTFQLAADGTSEDPGMAARLLVYLRVLHCESLYVAPSLAVLGAIALLRSKWQTGIYSGCTYLGSYVLYVAVFHYLANLDLTPLFLGVQARFWQQANLHVFVLAGVGVGVLQASAAQGCFVLDTSTSSTASATASSSSSSSPAWWTRVLRRSGKVLRVLIVLYCVAQCSVNFNTNDHSKDWMFYNSGKAVLKAMPLDSIVLLNGDLNNNIVKYVQQCEHVRRDVHLLQLQLLSWSWFVPLQSGMKPEFQRAYRRGHKYKLKELLHAFDETKSNYPSVLFPGIIYHPRNPLGGFSMREFLDYNQFVYDQKTGKKLKRRHVFKFGDWKEGDDSQQIGYGVVDYGMCEKVIRVDKPPRNLTAVYLKGLETFTFSDDLPFDRELQTPDTWEWVLHTDQFKKFVFYSGVLAYHSNNNATDEVLLLHAKRTMDILLDVVHVQGGEFVRTADWRTAGVIYGMHTKYLKQHDQFDSDEFYRSEWRMWWTWKVYGELTEDREILRIVRSGGNPYLNLPLHWLDSRGEHYGKPMGNYTLAQENNIYVPDLDIAEEEEPKEEEEPEEEVLFGEGDPEDELS